MEDICYPHFALQACPLGPSCSCAHDFGQLSNPDHWVIFKARNFVMLNFIAERYCQHQYFRHYSLVGYGSLVRCPTVDDAAAILEQYQKYGNPQSLREYIERSVAKKNWAHSNPPSKFGAWATVGNAVEEDEGWKASSQAKPGKQPKPAAKEAETPPPVEAPTSTPAPTLAPAPKDTKRTEEWLTQQVATRSVQQWVAKELEARIAKDLATRGMPVNITPVSRPSGDRDASKGDKNGDPSGRVLEVLRDNVLAKKAISAGWEALDKVWGIQKEDLDDAVLMYLSTKTPRQQEHILLTFAANNLTNVVNLSAYLNCVIKEQEATSQVCIHFYAGVCGVEACEYVHPINTRGWDLLEQAWGITYQDFDYAVLNYLSKKPMAQQDSILLTFAGMNLKTVNNLSAYLSSVVQKFEKLDARRPSTTDELKLCDVLAASAADPKPPTFATVQLRTLGDVEAAVPQEPVSPMVDLSAYAMYLLPANRHINAHTNAKPFIPVFN
eukprot:EG_transcript_4595